MISRQNLRSVALAAACVVLPAGSFAQIRPSLPPDSPFGGGVPLGVATSDTVSLSVLEVIKRALEHNLGVLLAEEGASGAAGAKAVALSELLPHVNGSVSEARRKTNLEAFGFPLREEFPRIVGPFNVFDARVFLSQTVLDLSAANGLRAAEHSLTAARHSSRSARDLVVLVAANLYLQTLATAARADTARALLDTARTLHQQAMNLRESGLVAGIDVVRAEVRLSTERQRVTAATNDYEKTKLQLARVIGLPIGQSFTLSQEIPFVPVPEMTLEEALERAYRDRPDYLAALERVQAAEASRKAIQGEALPSVRVTADYGTIGLHWSSALPTFNVVGTLDVPIFEGGRVQGRLAEADAELRTRRAEAEDGLTRGLPDALRFRVGPAAPGRLEVVPREHELLTDRAAEEVRAHAVAALRVVVLDSICCPRPEGAEDARVEVGRQRLDSARIDRERTLGSVVTGSRRPA